MFTFEEPENFHNRSVNIVLGDFNSHSITWGYSSTDSIGDLLENWAEGKDLKLLHDPKLAASFNSRRWRRGYNPDLIFTSNTISSRCTKRLEEPIPGTQHRPITCEINAVVKPETVSFNRRFNFKRANWDGFSDELDRGILFIEPVSDNYHLSTYLEAAEHSISLDFPMIRDKL